MTTGEQTETSRLQIKPVALLFLMMRTPVLTAVNQRTPLKTKRPIWIDNDTDDNSDWKV